MGGHGFEQVGKANTGGYIWISFNAIMQSDMTLVCAIRGWACVDEVAV
jgi:hypothetical protein